MLLGHHKIQQCIFFFINVVISKLLHRLLMEINALSIPTYQDYLFFYTSRLSHVCHGLAWHMKGVMHSPFGYGLNHIGGWCHPIRNAASYSLISSISSTNRFARGSHTPQHQRKTPAGCPNNLYGADRYT